MSTSNKQARPLGPRARAEVAASILPDAALASMLDEYAHEVERDTGCAYASAFMREAARRLAKSKS